MRARKAIVASAIALAALASPAHAQVAQATRVPGDFIRPVYVTSAPGTPSLLFVVEKAGVVRVLENEVLQEAPFLDIRTRVSTDGERGLLSIAFAPDYATSRLFYIAFTNLTGDIQLDEFQRSPTDAFRAAPGSRRRLLTIRHRDAPNHNGGQLQFGPDGLLYMSTGDGGRVFPRGKFARNLNSLLGKILRIDPAPDGGAPYTIPSGNPYAGVEGRRGEIFAYGLRNPWRFSFNGQRLVIGDVGQGDWEEINFLPLNSARGANFGWPAFEGNVPYDPEQPAPPDPPTFPMHVYSHDAGGCAVIGGYVSRDPGITALSRRYVYADFCTGQFRSFVPDVADQEARADRLVLQAQQPTSIGIGPDQRMYFTQNSGELMRIDALP